MTPLEEQRMRAAVSRQLSQFQPSMPTQFQPSMPNVDMMAGQQSGMMTPEQIAAASRSTAGKELDLKNQLVQANALRGAEAAKGKTVGPYDLYMGPNWGDMAASVGKQLTGGYMANQAGRGLDELDEEKSTQAAAAMGIERGDIEEAQGLARARLRADIERNRVLDEQAKIEAQNTADYRGSTLDLRQQEIDASISETQRKALAEEKEAKEKAKEKAEKRTPQQEKAFVDLEKAAPLRQSNINKATEFLTAFESGAESGASREGLSWVPGVYTDQGTFDELLDSFQEQAAREQLKAAGETRPTDADVERTKASLFGKGRDEATNKILLQNYLDDQIKIENNYRKEAGLEPIEAPEIVPVEGNWYEKIYGAGTPEASTPEQEQQVNDIKAKAVENGAQFFWNPVTKKREPV